LCEGILHDLAQRLYESWRIIESGAHLELCEAKLLRQLARLMIDLTQSLNVIGDKSDRNDTDLACLLRRELP